MSVAKRLRSGRLSEVGYFIELILMTAIDFDSLKIGGSIGKPPGTTRRRVMKPSWDEAPDWARYLAMDENGYWYWYQRRPKKGMHEWVKGISLIEEASGDSPTWTESLESRPFSRPPSPYP